VGVRRLVVLNLCTAALLVPYFLTRHRASFPAMQADSGASATAFLEAGFGRSRPHRGLVRIAAVGAAVVVDLDRPPLASGPHREWPAPDSGAEPLAVAADPAPPTNSGSAAAAPVPPPAPPAPPVVPKPKPPPPPPSTTTTTTTTSPPATAAPDTTTTAAPRNSQTGQASWYDAPAGTCAHRSLPFGTIVTVTNQSSGASTTCRVADRGPFVAGRIIDLSRDTFAKIASTSSGVIQVRIEW